MYTAIVFHHELDNLLYLIMNVSRYLRFAVVQVCKIHKCTLGKMKCRDEMNKFVLLKMLDTFLSLVDESMTNR